MIQVRQGKISIHTSDRIMFRRCRRKAFHASKLWQGLQPIRPNDVLWLGTGVHRGLEYYYGYNQDPVEVFEEWARGRILEIKQQYGLLLGEMAKFEEAIELGTGILEHYKLFASRYDNFTTHRFADGSPAVEVMFEVPIMVPGTTNQLHAAFNEPQAGMTPEQLEELNAKGNVFIPVYYAGRFDHIVEDTYGDLWIVDHKTCKTFGDWSKLDMDTQVGSYIWAAEQSVPLHKHISGVIYNGLKKSVPKPPELLKRGGLSKNKNQTTTPELYEQAVIDHGLDMVDYEEFIDYLRSKEVVTPTVIDTKYFRRQVVHRSREEVASIARDIYYEACDMIQANYFYPNPTRDCGWDCDFHEVCKSLNNKEDTDYLLSSLYEPRPEETDDFSVYAWQEE